MANIKIDDWSDQDLFYALFHAVDEIVESQPGLRDQFPEIRSALLDEVCREAEIDRQTAEENITDVPSSIIRETLKALFERVETRDLVEKWISEKPKDHVQGVDPITGSIALAGIYFVLTTRFAIKYKKTSKDSKVTYEFSRRGDVPQSFIKSIIDWFRGVDG